MVDLLETGADVQEFMLLVIVGLLLKHFVADYLLQFGWMLAEKGNFSRPGGYVHAAIHSAGSAIVLWLASVSVLVLLGLIVAEFFIHYLLDYMKSRFSDGVSNVERPHLFWALNGLDQLMHHLTYVGMVYIVINWGIV